ncbi:hypothetical protein A3C91_03815 [Candidatus Azambacteria bacterium RIFCSPHIGHO2_02_FULL_52_12]|uniref:Uncharacterized protein n=2 Tax=Parcubacteria group TaxID=1794811 RepID=A0A1G2FV10_9BACT|nr:MAG: hypothetical protein A3C91_03815 [Candidatus Azambacteria bacterium RIFCSPHIGHO2_02_FULL_52_12]OGD34005.1 MAG: hypothetical protein A2988_00780 [Candidatus Azambacteria bacterium RIFCSPLOWO2_01_FULL_46_25]OGD37707.1 MAG: hypothetical protein A2850_01745 [Candidatus Azambacteria bacterium RIFCSPHIGHO2_01_FULL_51_74]OGZ41909.1 MAG: hypothetical protein A2W41_02855 [Candidatus Ryanbacteria bacterium RIFCSPHIGHO2_01_45_13]
MEQQTAGVKKSWGMKIAKMAVGAVLVIFALFIILAITRIPHFIDKQKTEEQVAKIHATKLTLDDVMGKNLPPDPGAQADKTIAGIDANQNGIRDDVELAIFKEYPGSAKTRAVLLQYALVLQMEVTQPFKNTTNVTEVVREEDRADSCVADTLVPRESPESWRTPADIEKIDRFISFIESRQRNTPERKKARKDFVEKLGSFSPLDEEICDISFSMLPN